MQSQHRENAGCRIRSMESCNWQQATHRPEVRRVGLSSSPWGVPMLHPHYPSVSGDCLKAEVKAQRAEPQSHWALELPASPWTSTFSSSTCGHSSCPSLIPESGSCSPHQHEPLETTGKILMEGIMKMQFWHIGERRWELIMRPVSSILLSARCVCVNREIKLKMLECILESKGECIDLKIRSDTGPSVSEWRGWNFRFVWTREQVYPRLPKKGPSVLFFLVRNKFPKPDNKNQLPWMPIESTPLGKPEKQHPSNNLS